MDQASADSRVREIAASQHGVVGRAQLIEAGVSTDAVEYRRRDRSRRVRLPRGRSAFENDRRRDRALVSEGLAVSRVTWRQVQNEPEKVLARLCMALGGHAGNGAGDGS